MFRTHRASGGGLFTRILEAESFARLLERVRSMLAEQRTAQPSVAGRCPLLAS